ncbi:hypothetical protein D3C76_1345920 [compost metagenome]
MFSVTLNALALVNSTVSLLLALSKDTLPVLEEIPLYTLDTDFNGSLNSISTLNKSFAVADTIVGASLSSATVKAFSNGTTFRPEKS